MAIKLRPFQYSDIPEIDEIFRAQRDYGVPSLQNLVGHATIINDEKIVGYGTVKLFAECIMLISKDLTPYERSKAVIESIKLGIRLAKRGDLEQVYLISDDNSYCNLLIEHFGFRKVEGTLLTKDLED